MLDESYNIVQHEATELRGRLKLAAPVSFTQRKLLPVIEQFKRLHPEVELEILLSDSYIDLIREGVDVSIRVGSLDDSTLKVKKLGESRRCLVAGAQYLKDKNIQTLEDPENSEFSRFPF